MLSQQIDDYLPTRVVLAIGAARTYAARLNFFLGVPNTLMIAVLFYNDSPLVRTLFPTVYHWVGFILGVVVPAAFAVDRMVLHPSEVTYNAHQNSRENRNPGFRVTKENLRKLESVEDELDDIHRQLDALLEDESADVDSRDYREVVDGGRPELRPADISDERGDRRAP